MNLKMKQADQTHDCEFCGKQYVTETTLHRHTFICEKRRRILAKDEKYSIRAFVAFQKFYNSQYSNKPKTYKDFINSRYYSAFIKFGRYIVDVNPINVEDFIDFVIKTGIPLDQWARDHVYETYLKELQKKETPSAAVERSILLMKRWSEDTKLDWIDFFKIINTNLAVDLIRTGKISPWILYSAPSAQHLLDRMNEEQLNLIYETVNPTFWKRRLNKEKDEVAFIKQILNEVGL